MLIPMHHPAAEAGRAVTARRARQRDLDQWMSQVSAAVGAGARALLLLLSGVAFVRHGSSPLSVTLLAVAVALASAALLAGLLRPLPTWAALALDGVGVGLLIIATGGPSSPFLVLTIALLLPGALPGLGGDTLAGTGAGLVVLLLAAVLYPGQDATLLGSVAAAQLVLGAAATLWAREVRPTVLRLREEAARSDRADHDSGEARRAIEWQRTSAAAIASCASETELADQTAERAAAITGAPAAVDIADGAEACPGAHCVPIPGGGRIVVRRATADLSRSQRDALEQLAALAGQRAETLRSAGQLRRNHAALLALWEAAGTLRTAHGLQGVVPDACRRVATALDLDWLALVGHDERQMLAPLMLVRGRSGEPPRLQGAQLRVAAEALRSGRPLVRAEGGAVLACLPVRVGGETPIVLAARGDIDEAASQALLMVFGDLVAEHVTALA